VVAAPEEWLAAVKADDRISLVVRVEVLAHTKSDLTRHLFRHKLRLLPPTLIRGIIDVAVSAIQVAPASQLPEVLMERNDVVILHELPH
jgi:hypothetical protein